MKKLFLFSIIAAAMSVASCTNSDKTESVTTDSCAVDTCVVEPLNYTPGDSAAEAQMDSVVDATVLE